MNRSNRFPAWLERRGYPIRTKKRIAVGNALSTVEAPTGGPVDVGNVVPLASRTTLRAATTDCPEVSILVLPKRRLRGAG